MTKYTVHARLLFMTANWFISHTVIEVPRSIAPGSREHHTVRTPSASFGICSRVVASSRDETGTCLGITNSIFKQPWLLRSLTRKDSTQLLNLVNLYASTKKHMFLCQLSWTMPPKLPLATYYNAQSLGDLMLATTVR